MEQIRLLVLLLQLLVAAVVAVQFLALFLEMVRVVVLEVALVTPEEQELLDQELRVKGMLVVWVQMD
jgi:hypothetical protein